MPASTLKKKLLFLLIALFFLQCIVLKTVHFNTSTYIYWTIYESALKAKDNWYINLDAYFTNLDILSENKKLLTENEKLKVENLVNKSKLISKKQIKSIPLRNTKDDDWLEAKVLSCFSDHAFIRVDKNKHVKKDSLVIQQDGVYGTISNDCFGKYCQVNLLNHPETSIAVSNKNDRLHGLLNSNVNGDLILNYLDSNYNLLEEDVLYTAGFSTQQPSGFPVVKVKGKIMDLQKKTHYYLGSMSSINCPNWSMVWSPNDA